MRKFFLFIVVLLGVANVSAQNIAIKSFVQSDMTVVDTHPVTDHNGEYGATIRFWIQGKDEDYDIQFNNGILKRENRNGVILCWVPKTTTRITKLRYKEDLPLTGYRIPIKLESRMTYDARIEFNSGKIVKTELAANAESKAIYETKVEKKRKHYVYLGAGYNLTSIAGPSLSFGANINHHNLEIEGIWGLNKTGNIDNFIYKAVRGGFRYGYEVVLFKYLSITPEVGIAYTKLDNEISIDYSSRIIGLQPAREIKVDDGFSAIGGVRLIVPIIRRFKLCITPEYNYGIFPHADEKRVIESDKTLESFFSGFNLNASLILFL